MLVALLLLAPWLAHPDTNIPRAKDGKPDLSGIWLPDNTPGINGTNGEPLPKYFISVTFDMKNEDVPFTPEGAAIFRRNLAGNGKDDPTATCHPIGTPAVDVVPIPYNIIQTPGLTAILYEGDTVYRQIFTDGRQHAETTIPSWMGWPSAPRMLVQRLLDERD